MSKISSGSLAEKVAFIIFCCAAVLYASKFAPEHQFLTQFACGTAALIGLAGALVFGFGVAFGTRARKQTRALISSIGNDQLQQISEWCSNDEAPSRSEIDSYCKGRYNTVAVLGYMKQGIRCDPVATAALNKFAEAAQELLDEIELQLKSSAPLPVAGTWDAEENKKALRLVKESVLVVMQEYLPDHTKSLVEGYKIQNRIAQNPLFKVDVSMFTQLQKQAGERGGITGIRLDRDSILASIDGYKAEVKIS